jgi:circadian clock protein KaiC
MHGLEMHLTTMHKVVEGLDPRVVVVDPVSNIAAAGTLGDAGLLLTRLIDFLKRRGITSLMTNLTSGGEVEQTAVAISSLVDTWLLLRNVERDGERHRTLVILKARGLAHSSQVRPFLLTGQGVDLDERRLSGEKQDGGSRPAKRRRR